MFGKVAENYGIQRKKLETTGTWRIKKKERIPDLPIEIDGNFLIEDYLEEDGTLKLLEHLGGSLYVPSDPTGMGSKAVVVASLEIAAEHDKKEVRLKRIFCEHGYDFESILFQQVVHFCKYYDYAPVLLDIKKRESRRNYAGHSFPMK